MIGGREYSFTPDELRGPGATRLLPGQRAAVRLVGGSELVRLAVDTGAPVPAPVALPRAAAAPAPLSTIDVARVTAWATRRAAVFLAFLVGAGGWLVKLGSPTTALHAIFAVILAGLAWALADAVRTLLAARALAPGGTTRHVAGTLRHGTGLLRDTFLDGQRLADAGEPRAPRLATKARARVVALPVPDRGQREMLVAVEWVTLTD